MADPRRLGGARGRVPLALCVLLAAPRVFGQDGAEKARALLGQGKAGEAIALLKAEIERQPSDKPLRLWLARAYLADGNDFWALRTLSAAAALHPEDCNLTLWQAFVQIKQGEVEQARDLLQSACPTWPPTMARRSLLLAMVEQGAGATAAAQNHLDQARAARFAFPEDREAMARMASQLDPGFVAPFSGRLDLAMGGTSNARAGSPVDPVSQGNGARSLALSALASARFVSPNRSFARFSAEAEIRGLGYQAEAGRDYSYLMLSGRPGLLLTGKGRRLLLGYRYESFLLAGGDRYDPGPLWFFEAHRGEWEMELSQALTFFGGVGRRAFRETGRTRTEIDGGLGGGFPAGERLQVMAALSARYHDAENDAYDQRGVSVLLSAEHRSPRRWSARAGVLASIDDYPRSTGYFDPSASTTARRDLGLRLSASAFAPPFRNRVKLGLTYEFAVRDSSAAPYDYTDHRVLAKLIWTFTADPWLPHPATPVGHVPIDYGFGAAEVAERVQDLLRQGEAAQRSSSCRE
jgi:thioredoxin-like negative regulator of GroEL